MVLLLAAAGAALVWYLATQRIVDGYVKGQLVRFSVVPIGGGAKLRPDAAQAWFRMLAHALSDGVVVMASPGEASGFRTSEQQAALRVRLGAFGEGGLAAAVNASPHQTGYALDVAFQNPVNADYDAASAAWLRANGPSYGWFPVGDGYRTTKEPWHFEYTPKTGVFA